MTSICPIRWILIFTCEETVFVAFTNFFWYLIPDIWYLLPDIWICGHLGIWASGYLNIWISGIWISWFLDVWISGYLDSGDHPHSELLYGAFLAGAWSRNNTSLISWIHVVSGFSNKKDAATNQEWAPPIFSQCLICTCFVAKRFHVTSKGMASTFSAAMCQSKWIDVEKMSTRFWSSSVVLQQWFDRDNTGRKRGLGSEQVSTTNYWFSKCRHVSFRQETNRSVLTIW